MAISKLTLYDDQAECFDDLREGFRMKKADGSLLHQCQLLYAPTGAGKTEIAMAMLQMASEKERRAAMALDRIVLCDQTSKRLDKYGIPHGVLQSGHWRYRPHEKIQVCSAQTLEKRGLPGVSLLIIDECHDQRKQLIDFLREHPQVYGIGLSASPFTKGLASTYTRVVSATTTAKLVQIGRLVPLKVFIAKQIDMKGSKKVGGEYSSDEASARGMRITGDVVTEWQKMTTLHFGGPRKTIVFCANVAHGADLAAKFAEAGFNFLAISYLSDEDFKKEAIADFGKPDTKIHGLIACDILTKGFDVPDVMIGVSARPFAKSFSSHVQQMGRVMRAIMGLDGKADFEKKSFALWLDHSGNFLKFRSEWEDLYHEGVQQLKDEGEKTKPELKDKEIEASRCPKCSSLWPRNSDSCPNCGHTRVRLNLIEHVDGELVELGAGANRETKQDWYSQILWYANAKHWSRGFVMHKYRERFGVWPQGMKDVPKPMTTEVAKWIKSRQIAWAEAQKKARV